MTEAEAQAIGKTPTGWKHIEESRIEDLEYTDPVKNQFAKAFDPTGVNYRDPDSIKNLVMDCAKTGVEDPNDAGVFYKRVTDKKAIQVVVGSNGYVVTAHPIEISRVPDSVIL